MKLGVFGGTFDPIHLGHLHVAQRIRKLFELSEIHFVVATSPPHKTSQGIIPLHHRFSMVSLATSNSRAFIPSLIELEPPASPYSIHTLGKLARRKNRKALDLYFIAGADSLLDVSNWRAGEEMVTTYNFIFVCRPGVGRIDPTAVLPRKAVSRVRDFQDLGIAQVRKRMSREEKSEENRIYIVDIRARDISSSRIRTLVSLGKRTRHLLPAAVYGYIQKLQIYGER